MGQRANFVIVEDRMPVLYYDHSCANRLDVDLLWGPEFALDYIRQREPADAHTHLLDDVWCEGGAILDLDRRELRWFGGEDVLFDIPRRRVLLELQRATWPGWTVQWASDGIVAIASALGLGPDRVLTDPEGNSRAFSQTASLAFPEDNDMILTRRLKGAVEVWRACFDIDPLFAGPSCFPPELKGESVPLVCDPSAFCGGIHLDVDQGVLSIWLAPNRPGLRERLPEHWPGVKISWLGDRFETHATLAPELRFRPAADRCQIADEIVQHARRIGRLNGGIHALGVAANPQGSGSEIGPGPSLDRVPTSNHARRSAVLRQLEEWFVGRE